MLQTESCVLVEIVANGTKQLWRVAWKRYELLERNHSSRDVYSYDDEKALQTFFPLEMIIPSSIAQRMWMITCASVWQRQMFIPWTNPDHLWIRGKRDQVPSKCKSKTNLHMHRLNNLTSKLYSFVQDPYRMVMPRHEGVLEYTGLNPWPSYLVTDLHVYALRNWLTTIDRSLI